MAKLITFNVRVIVKDAPPQFLGTIKAVHQPAAVAKAWKKWPQFITDNVQGGFSVLEAKGDNL